ncbi:hypothetical protein HDU91_003102, partial [Kappamyces sp. JEL0680]
MFQQMDLIFDRKEQDNLDKMIANSINDSDDEVKSLEELTRSVNLKRKMSIETLANTVTKVHKGMASEISDDDETSTTLAGSELLAESAKHQAAAASDETVQNQ